MSGVNRQICHVTQPEWETTADITVYTPEGSAPFLKFSTLCMIIETDDDTIERMRAHCHSKVPGCAQLKNLVLLKDVSTILRELVGWGEDRISRAMAQLAVLPPAEEEDVIEVSYDLRTTIRDIFVKDIVPLIVITFRDEIVPRLMLEEYKKTPDYQLMVTTAKRELLPIVRADIEREAVEFVRKRFAGNDNLPPQSKKPRNGAE